MTANTKETRFVAALPVVARLETEDLLGSLVALRPLGTREIETKHGVRPAVDCRFLEIGDDGVRDLGEHPIFWMYVQRELGRATPERPWVAGRLATSGQAIVLDPLTDAEVELIAEALERVEVG